MFTLIYVSYDFIMYFVFSDTACRVRLNTTTGTGIDGDSLCSIDSSESSKTVRRVL